MNKIGLILYQPYKWLIFAPLFIVYTILGSILTVVLSVFSHQKAFYVGRIWAKLTQWTLPVRVSVKGNENIAKGASYVVMANHESAMDIIAIYGSLRVNFRWIMKAELRKAPLIGWACDKGRHIFIDRKSARAAYRSLQRAKQILVDGTSVVIFPEGTRNYSNELTRFKSGGFKLAEQLGLPILPVSIKDTYKVMGKSIGSLRPGRVEMTIHPSIDTLAYKETPEILHDKVRESIEKGL